MRDIDANRDLICPYCFFSGPDKSSKDKFAGKLDLSGSEKLFDP
jgi:hypothetical protein